MSVQSSPDVSRQQNSRPWTQSKWKIHNLKRNHIFIIRNTNKYKKIHRKLKIKFVKKNSFIMGIFLKISSKIIKFSINILKALNFIKNESCTGLHAPEKKNHMCPKNIKCSRIKKIKYPLKKYIFRRRFLILGGKKIRGKNN